MRFLCRAILVAALLLALPVAAQDDLAYGTTITGQTGAQYRFSGKAGDLVTVEAFAIPHGLIPVLTLLNASGRQVAQAQSDPLTPGSTVLAYHLLVDGDYTLGVSGLYGSAGEFVLRLEGKAIFDDQPLVQGTNKLQLDSTVQVYSFNAPAEIHLSATDLAFTAEIHDQDGRVVAQINDVPRAAFAIDSSGTFEMMISSTRSGIVAVDYLDRPDLAPTAEPTASSQ